MTLPSILISEPTREILASSEVPPVEILFSGVTSLESGTSVLLRLDNTDGESLTSSCADSQSILSESNGGKILKWKLTERCRMPIVKYRGVNYIMPISGALPPREALSDISSETLNNTLRASTVIKNDYRLSSIRLRQFFADIETILATRNTHFSYPIPGSSLPNNNSHLPNAARPFRVGTTDAVHHGWDFYVSEGTPVRAIE